MSHAIFFTTSAGPRFSFLSSAHLKLVSFAFLLDFASKYFVVYGSSGPPQATDEPGFDFAIQCRKEAWRLAAEEDARRRARLRCRTADSPDVSDGSECSLSDFSSADVDSDDERAQSPDQDQNG